RLVVVDRAPRASAKVARGAPGRLRRSAEGGHFGERARRKVGVETAGAHGGDGYRAQLVALGHDRSERAVSAATIESIDAAKSSTSASTCRWCVRKLRMHTRPRYRPCVVHPVTITRPRAVTCSISAFVARSSSARVAPGHVR